MLRRAIREALEAEDDITVVACCVDGQEAIEALDRARPDIVVTDLSMPRLDGVMTIREIRRRQPQVHVLVLTSMPHGQQAAHALDAGAEAIIAKAADPSLLIAAVRTLTPKP